MPPSKQLKNDIPAWLIWIQCIAFVVLYAVWILPEVVGFRNTALVFGAIAGLYPIYQYRDLLYSRRAVPIWLIWGLFLWATLHLFFLSTDFDAQFLEFKRIWKYAAIGSIFAFGLGISLIVSSANLSIKHSDVLDDKKQNKSSPYWAVIYFGLCTPVLIYLLKYVLSTYGGHYGIEVPAYLKIYFGSQPYYIPKTDYVAFCLPTLAVALAHIEWLLSKRCQSMFKRLAWFWVNIATVAGVLFLFYVQDIKNGMAYASLCISLFVFILLFKKSHISLWKKLLFVLPTILVLGLSLLPHIQKNDSWRTLIADTKVALQTEQYQQWKHAGAQGYPNNEYGKMVSITNYERAAWFKVGSGLAIQNPLGYGLVEDSFKRMAKQQWPEVSPYLSHSHSGWLDVILAVGFPGFLMIAIAMALIMRQSGTTDPLWGLIVFWSLVSQVLLWITTEVSATVTFAALIFWICLASGLVLSPAAGENTKSA